MLDKELATKNYLEMIKQSWTWGRLTEKEKRTFEYLITEHSPIKNSIKGTYKQRYELANDLYYTFLMGCGYDNDINWRE